MRRLFVAARANPKLWAGLFREQLPDHEILEEMPADDRPRHAFWRHPKILVSPHAAAPRHPGMALVAMVEDIRRREAGQPGHHIVDRRRGD